MAQRALARLVGAADSADSAVPNVQIGVLISPASTPARRSLKKPSGRSPVSQTDQSELCSFARTSGRSIHKRLHRNTSNGHHPGRRHAQTCQSDPQATLRPWMTKESLPWPLRGCLGEAKQNSPSRQAHPFTIFCQVLWQIPVRKLVAHIPSDFFGNVHAPRLAATDSGFFSRFLGACFDQIQEG
jgi:hypothetical protein